MKTENEMEQKKFQWNEGLPPRYVANEWFFAKLKNETVAALKALPENYSYDFKTADETYFAKDWIVGWMQTPDTDYLFPHEVTPPVKP